MNAPDFIVINTSLKFFSKLYKCCTQLGTYLVLQAESLKKHHLINQELKEVIVHRTHDTQCANGLVRTTDMLPV